LTESSAIAYYIADSAEDASMRAQLLGADAYSRAKILQYVFFAEMHIGEPILTLVGWRLGFGVYDKAKEDLHAAYMSNFLRYLEGEIKDKTWFVGDSGPTLADITIGGHIYVGLLGYIDAEMRKDYPELIRWYESLKSVPDLTELYTGPMVDVRKQPKED
jgi:elongation factor 1-gamma